MKIVYCIAILFSTIPLIAQTNLTIHYFDNSEKDYMRIQQFDTLPHLKDYPYIPFTQYTLKNQEKKHTLHLKIQELKLLCFDFNEILVFPNTNIDVSYRIFEKNPYFKDTLVITKGDAMYFKNESVNYDFSTYKNVDSIVNYDYLMNVAQTKVNTLSLHTISPRNLQVAKDYALQYYKKRSLLSVLVPLKHSTFYKTDSVNVSYTKVKTLLEKLSYDHTTLRDHYYWLLIKQWYKFYLNQVFEKNNFEEQMILNTLQDVEPLTKQYILLLTIQSAVKNDLNCDHILQHIQDDYFKTKAIKLIENPVSEAFYALTLRNYNNEKVTLGDILKHTQQPKIYLDFCGTWCIPCIQEMEEYAKNKRFENSSELRPIYIFFEKDTTKWHALIEKYNIKKEDCFILYGEDDKPIHDYFSRNFYWRRTFPHHFLFRKNGVLLDYNAEPLHKLIIR